MALTRNTTPVEGIVSETDNNNDPNVSLFDNFHADKSPKISIIFIFGGNFDMISDDTPSIFNLFTIVSLLSYVFKSHINSINDRVLGMFVFIFVCVPTFFKYDMTVPVDVNTSTGFDPNIFTNVLFELV